MSESKHLPVFGNENFAYKLFYVNQTLDPRFSINIMRGAAGYRLRVHEEKEGIKTRSAGSRQLFDLHTLKEIMATYLTNFEPKDPNLALLKVGGCCSIGFKEFKKHNIAVG